MMERLVVLGGSTPFTAAFVDALAEESPRLPVFEMVLHGRSASHLERMACYARGRLGPAGWHVRQETEVDRALSGASLVVHQIRYGGMEGRAADEALALRFGIQPDETLGPAAFRALLRSARPLRVIASRIEEECPDAWVLNLTNPLSATTTLLGQAGVRRCMGLCELPRVTATRAAAALGVPLERVSWTYHGLNHRGFILRFEFDGVDAVPHLVGRLGGGALEGIPGDVIARLSAIPTKYFRFFLEGFAPEPGRAAFLSSLRRRIHEEMRDRPDRSPPSLRERYLEWYPVSVVPMVAALSSSRETVHVVNVMETGGVTREGHARVSREAVRLLDAPAPEGEVARWVDRFDAHERVLLEAVRSPGLRAIQRALEGDPLVPSHVIPEMARILWAEATAMAAPA